MRRLVGSALLAVLAGSCAARQDSIRDTAATRAADSLIKEAIRHEDSIDPGSFPPSTVGILPFRVEAGGAELNALGFGLAELMMSDLAISRQMTVVDRLRIHALLREFELIEQGVADPSTGPHLGLMLGARYLVLGTLASESFAEFSVTANLIRTQERTLQPVVDGVADLDDFFAAEKALVFRVFDELQVTLTPAERAAIERRQTRNLAALLAFSRGAKAEAELRFDEARREFYDAIRARSLLPGPPRQNQ